MAVAMFTICGTLGADPEIQFSQGGGNPYARVSVCVDRWDASAKEERQSWFWCVLFGAVSERFAERAQKGSTVLLIGEMQEDGGEHKGRHSFIVREFDVVRNWRERAAGGNRGDDRHDGSGYDRRDDPRSEDNRRAERERGGSRGGNRGGGRR